jgi:transcriptional/translational regulatory protein YebC/TACO1
MIFIFWALFLNAFFYFRYYFKVLIGSFNQDYSSDETKNGLVLAFKDDFDGVEDLNTDAEENIIDIYTSRESFRDVYKAIETLGLHLLSGTLIKEASETVTLTEEGWEKLDQLIEAVEELEDVNNVWHNANTN